MAALKIVSSRYFQEQNIPVCKRKQSHPLSSQYTHRVTAKRHGDFHRTRFQLCAQDDQFKDLMAGSGKIADGITDVVRPAGLPRPLAKAIVVFLGAGFVFSIFKKLLSLAIFLAVLGGGAFLLFKSQTAGSGSKGEADDSGFGAAKQIMDKYK